MATQKDFPPYIGNINVRVQYRLPCGITSTHIAVNARLLLGAIVGCSRPRRPPNIGLIKALGVWSGPFPLPFVFEPAMPEIIVASRCYTMHHVGMVYKNYGLRARCPAFPDVLRLGVVNFSSRKTKDISARHAARIRKSSHGPSPIVRRYSQLCRSTPGHLCIRLSRDMAEYRTECAEGQLLQLTVECVRFKQIL